MNHPAIATIWVNNGTCAGRRGGIAALQFDHLQRIILSINFATHRNRSASARPILPIAPMMNACFAIVAHHAGADGLHKNCAMLRGVLKNQSYATYNRSSIKLAYSNRFYTMLINSKCLTSSLTILPLRLAPPDRAPWRGVGLVTSSCSPARLAGFIRLPGTQPLRTLINYAFLRPVVIKENGVLLKLRHSLIKRAIMHYLTSYCGNSGALGGCGSLA
jgi:hypothetical protein